MLFPFICSNIPAAPACGVYISQLIQYSRACGSYQDFLDRGLLLTRKLLIQGFLLVKLKSSLRKFYGSHHYIVDRYEISVILAILFRHFGLIAAMKFLLYWLSNLSILSVPDECFVRTKFDIYVLLQLLSVMNL